MTLSLQNLVYDAFVGKTIKIHEQQMEVTSVVPTVDEVKNPIVKFYDKSGSMLEAYYHTTIEIL